MKRFNTLTFYLLGLALVFGVTGCRKNPDLVHLPGPRPLVSPGPIPPMKGSVEPGKRVDFTDPATSGYTLPDPANSLIGGAHNKDRDTFKEQTVYFKLDSSVVDKDEQSKVEAVANYLQANRSSEMLIEGHCDERGTEGYNLSLGERRALSLREFLVNLGVSPDRVHVISHGESMPAVQGKNEAAYSKNRRGEFVLILPAQ